RALVREPRRDRPPLPHGSPARIRDHVDRAARRGRRWCRAGPQDLARGRGVVLGPDPTWYVAVAAVLFAIGTTGVVLRRSPLIVLLSLEIMLNSSNLALVAFSRHFGTVDGQVFAISVMAVAAAEVCVGLGMIVAFSRRRLELDVDALTELRG